MRSPKTIFLESLIAVALITKTLSFSGCRTSFLVPRQSAFISRTSRQHDQTISTLSALIYGWDEGDDECEVSDSYIDDRSGVSLCSSVGIALAESIGRNPDKVGTLARLAVAFSPPERTVNLKDIENVNLACVSEKHIEIEAVLCEEHDCVTLLVPIQFPHDCGQDVSSDVLEKCVNDNLGYLDVEVDSLVTKSNNSENDGDEVNLEELSKDFSYPSWWVSPKGSNDLVVECDTIARILSEPDFQEAVNDLASKGLEAIGMKRTYKIKRAVLCAVGPAGFCFKALASSRLGGEAASNVILDVPVPFGGEPRLEPELLRAAVLGEVAAGQVL